MPDLAYGTDALIGAPAAPDDQATVRQPGIEPWQGHPVDFGLSIGGFYVRLVIGRERRAPGRRKQDRAARPLGTIGNMLFAGSISGIVFTVLIVVVLVYSSILSE